MEILRKLFIRSQEIEKRRRWPDVYNKRYIFRVKLVLARGARSFILAAAAAAYRGARARVAMQLRRRRAHDTNERERERERERETETEEEF